MAKEYLTRLEYLVGEDRLELLSKKHVLICGCGGVGSFVAEGLARSGVGYITLCDFDKVDSSNLNRQLMTTKNNIGLNKTAALKNHLEEICDAQIEVENCFIDDKYVLVKKYDYVVDCIDSLTSKFILVKKCHEKNIPVISSLGTAKRIKIENIVKTTLDKTENDPLAKAFRNLVKKEKYKKKINVIYSNSNIIKTSIIKEEGKNPKDKYPLGSSIFTVGSVGLYIASYVFQKLLEE